MTRTWSVVCSTPKSYLPSQSSVCEQPTVLTTHNAADARTETSGIETSAGGLVSYDFISNPVKKAFFESPVSTVSPETATRQQVMLDKSDIDINLEAKINQYVAMCTLTLLPLHCTAQHSSAGWLWQLTHVSLCTLTLSPYYAPAAEREAGALGGHRRPSSVRPSDVAYIGSNSKTKRPRK